MVSLALTSDRGANVRERLSSFVVYASLVLITLFFSITLGNDGFLTSANLLNILRQTAMVSIMAIGVTFALSAGEIDLSIGATVALSALVVAETLRTQSLIVAVAAGLAVGIAVGLVNGLLTTKLRIPSFLVTLGMTGVVAGIARNLTDLQAVAVTNETYNFVFGSGDIGPIPILVVWTLVILLVGHLVYRKFAFGRRVLATGGNRVAARHSGINTDRVRIAVLVISASSAALAGMLYAGRLHGARYTLGEADLLTVIAAAIIGGTSLFGGKGSVVGAVVGSLVMGVLNNGLILMGLSVNAQMIARGLIIIAAVALSLREPKEA
ncbi:MAG: Ribose transport system permease protein RbsC [Marmoricola sp.]|jgi:ribose transport system permease protein|nr:Ribose transport system permease protein RbsC [Marmoricola sp.]